MTRPRPDGWLSAIVAATVVKGLVLLALVPPFQTPDEYAHYDYGLYLSYVGASRFLTGHIQVPSHLVPDTYTTRELYALADATGQRPHLEDAVIVRPPVSLRDARAAMAGWTAPDDEASRLASLTTWNGAFNYPPLYHALVGAVARTTRLLGRSPVDAFVATRLLSLLLFTAAVVSAWRLSLLLGLTPAFSRLVAFATAFQPQLTLQSISVQPDNLSLLLVILGLTAVTALTLRPSRLAAAAAGLVIGLLLLTKTHLAVPLAAGVGLSALLAAGRREQSWSDLARSVAIAAATAVLVGGWWYVRSRILYGNWAGVVAFAPAVEHAGAVQNVSFWVSHVAGETFASWWGQWGWLDYGLPAWTSPWLAAVSLLPALSLGLAWWARPKGAARDRTDRERGLLVIAAIFVVFGLEMIGIAAVMGNVQGQGRHWLPYAYPSMLYLCAPAALVSVRLRRAVALRLSVHRRLVASIVAAALALGVVGATASLVQAPIDGYIDVTAAVTGDSFMEVFYDTGRSFVPDDAARVAVRTRDGMRRYRFPVRGQRLERLRLDPLGGPGEVRLSTIDVADVDGRLVVNVPLAGIRALSDIETIRQTGTGVLVRSTPRAVDPALELPLPIPIELSGTRASRAAAAPRHAWQGLVRRVPLLGLLPFAWPTLLGLAIYVMWSTRGERRGHGPDRATSTLAVAYVTVFLLLDVYLMAATYRYYRDPDAAGLASGAVPAWTTPAGSSRTTTAS